MGTVEGILLITAVISLITAIIGLITALLNRQHGQQRSFLSGNQPSNRQRQVFTWAVLVVVGVVGVTISGQFLGDQLPQLSPQDSPGDVSQQPSTEDLPDTPSNSRDSDSRERTSPDDPSSSSTAVDYSRLEDFLQTEQWEEANSETMILMMEVARGVESSSIEDFPCDVLNRIDRLWVDNSEEKFGFSVQKQIFIENCGGKLNGQYDKAWDCWYLAVGWKNESKDGMDRRVIAFDTSAVDGHLPFWVCWDAIKTSNKMNLSYLMQKFVNCSI